MENIEKIDIVETAELMEEVGGSSGSGIAAVAIIGGAAVAGAVLWDRVLKPGMGWAKAKWKNAMANRAKKADEVIKANESSVK